MIPLKDTQTSGRLPYLTIALILVNLYVFYLELVTPNLDQIILSYALIPAKINLSDLTTLYPFVTALFLHGGFLHIASNMLFLWVFGDNVEHRLGFWYLPFYVLGGAVANFGQYIVAPDSSLPVFGASGAIAVILGAYLVCFPRHRITTLLPIIFFFTLVRLPAYVLLAYWFVLQLFNGALSLSSATAGDVGGVAYLAHIAGFVFGVLVGVGFRPGTEES